MQVLEMYLHSPRKTAVFVFRFHEEEKNVEPSLHLLPPLDPRDGNCCFDNQIVFQSRTWVSKIFIIVMILTSITVMIIHASLRGGPRTFLPLADHRLCPHDHRHPPPLPPHDCQSCSGE